MDQIRNPRRLSRMFIPAVVFAVVLAGHYVWRGLFPESGGVQGQWVSVPSITAASWWQRYAADGNYYLGFSYAVSLAFAAVCLRRYREERQCRARNLTVGGITLSGVLGVVGCYLVGCCGSPMLIVYVNLFGIGFLPLVKPAVPVITLAFVTLGYWWMNRSRKAAGAECSSGACESP